MRTLVGAKLQKKCEPDKKKERERESVREREIKCERERQRERKEGEKRRFNSKSIPRAILLKLLLDSAY